MISGLAPILVAFLVPRFSGCEKPLSRYGIPYFGEYFTVLSYFGPRNSNTVCAFAAAVDHTPPITHTATHRTRNRVLLTITGLSDLRRKRSLKLPVTPRGGESSRRLRY